MNISQTDHREDMVTYARLRTFSLDVGKGLPLVITPIKPMALDDARDEIEEIVAARLPREGAILLRGFEHDGIDGFEAFTGWFADQLLAYEYGSTPRTHLKGGIYTSTEYPSSESIPLHNEMAYTSDWPMKIWFYSDIVAERGGETPIADSRMVYRAMPESVRDVFERKRVMYLRNYRKGLDVPWQKTFGTEDKRMVEIFCDKNSIEYEWRNGDELRTRQICQGVARHPATSEMVWFNQAHLFHISNMPAQYRQAMLSLFKPDELPRNALFGDGSQIDDATLDEVRGVLVANRVVFPWQRGDILMLDNMLVAHSREPFAGARRVVVAMAENFSAQ